MTLSDEWADLERRLPTDRDGRMIRRIHPESPSDLRITAALGGRRGLELEIGREAVADMDPPPGTKAVSLSIDPMPADRAALSLTLTDSAAGDLFAALCGDVAQATAAASSDEDAVAAWLGRFTRWRRLLERGPAGLTGPQQRGLFAELWALRDLLSPTVGVGEAVDAWKGPEGAPRDFETSGVGLEVKGSAANEPQVVRVNGERQLDDEELDALFLAHLSLEVLRDAGETLPDIVASVRELAGPGPSAGPLDDRLLASGYADSQASLYGRTGYALRRLSILEVRDAFPRITERSLPDGVGAVYYSLAIEACRDYEVNLDGLTRHLSPRGD